MVHTNAQALESFKLIQDQVKRWYGPSLLSDGGFFSFHAELPTLHHRIARTALRSFILLDDLVKTVLNRHPLVVVRVVVAVL